MLKYMDKIHLILISCVVILLYDTQVLIYKLFITPKIGVENWVLLIFDWAVRQLIIIIIIIIIIGGSTPNLIIMGPLLHQI